MLIGGNHLLARRKGAYKHQKRRFRQVEVCDERVNGLETVARRDENVRPTAFRVHDARVVRHAFERTAGGGADGYDPPARGVRRIDGGSGGLAYLEIFRMHVVLFHGLCGYGAEGAEPNMQQHVGDHDALFAQLSSSASVK